MISILETINNSILTYILIAVLISLGLFFSIKTGFVQFRYFGEMFKLLTDKATITTEGKEVYLLFKLFVLVPHHA